jgi:hypothetical protein
VVLAHVESAALDPRPPTLEVRRVIDRCGTVVDMVRGVLPFVAVSVVLLACDRDDASEPMPVSVLVTLENISAPGALSSSTTQETRDILVSPGVWAVHAHGTRLFDEGEAATHGLTRLAESGNPEPMMLELSGREEIVAFGPFPVQEGATYASAPIEPGDSVTFEMSAMSDQRLSFAAMYIHSNDILVATPLDGIELDSEEVVDVSSLIELWDAGTELNEEPGFGEHQPMQGPDGDPEGGVVHRVEGTDAAGWSYPSPDSFLRVTVERRTTAEPPA